MKRLLGMALLLASVFVARADQPGQSIDLACRDNDPYVFCTQGCKDRDKNWIPLVPIAGTWISVPGYCPWPQSEGACCVGQVCFALWTRTAVEAVGQYMAICPRAHEQGDWESYNGQGAAEDEPYSH